MIVNAYNGKCLTARQYPKIVLVQVKKRPLDYIPLPGVNFINCFAPNPDLSFPIPNFYAMKKASQKLGVERK